MKRYPNKEIIKKAQWPIFLLMIGLFLLMRCSYLDQDLPPTGICAYIAIDEMGYTGAAFNLYHYKDLLYNPVAQIDSPLNEDMQPQPSNILETIMTYLSLSMFGNNYYGLRIASVLAAFILFSLFFVVLKELKDDDEQSVGQHRTEHREHINYFILLYLMFDFSFLMAARVAEPTIFRMLALAIIIFVGSRRCFSSTLQTNWHSLLLGFLSMAAVVFVYVYNAFILIAMLVTITVWSRQGGIANTMKQTAFFLLGAAICAVCYEWYIEAYYHTSIINYFQSLAPFRHRIGIGTNAMDSLESLLTNLIFIAMTNIFRFNIVLLFIFLISLPLFIDKLWKKRANFDVLVFNLVLFLLMQSVIINDYPLRKLVIILPLVLLVSASACFEGLNARFYGARYPRVYWFGCMLISLTVWLIYMYSYINGEHYEEIKIAMYFNLFTFVFVVSAMSGTYVQGKNLSKVCLTMCAIIIMLPNIYLAGRYIYYNPTFYYRDAMIGMSDIIDDRVTAGGCSQAFRLYNSSVPVLDAYISLNNPEKREDYDRYFDYLLENDIAQYSVAYVNDTAPESALSSAYLNNHGLELVEQYELGNHVNARAGVYAMQK